jgi:type VI secretion system secreted protein Hcp
MAFDAFLKIKGVDGESTRKGFEKHIEIFSFSWGAHNPVDPGSAGGGTGAGRVTLSSFNIMKKVDSASPSLFGHCCTGKHFESATVTLNKASGDKETALPFLKYEFEEVFVESLQASGASGGDDKPSESVSFAFNKVKFTYTPQTGRGQSGSPTSAAYDQRSHTAS